MLDLVVDRRELKGAVTRVLRFGGAGLPRLEAPAAAAQPAADVPA